GAIATPSLKQDVTLDVSMPSDGTSVELGLRPEHITIDRAGSTHKVDLTEALGGVSYAYLLAENGERLIVEERGEDRVKAGETVGISFDATQARLFDGNTEKRIR
ncbi:MAG: TOBE domain-containing protein, partial [Pseudomonadota bacterium]